MTTNTIATLAFVVLSFHSPMLADWVQTNGPFGGTVTSFAVFGTNIFAGTSGGVFLSTTNGTSWTAQNIGLTDPYVRCLAVSGTNLFAGAFYGGVFRSTNNGTSWTAASTGLPTDFSLFALAVSGTNLFAGGRSFTATDDGVFRSTDGGTSWTAASTGLPTQTVVVTALAVSGTNLFAGTTGGVWRRPLSEMITATSVDGHSIDLPAHFSLAQNFPNPFNPSTIIRYGLPQRADVRLVVFNTLGQQVATLVNESEDSGYHDVRFDASNLSSGVYFYRLQAGAFVEAKKLVLVR